MASSNGTTTTRKILVLHGSRQTGQLLLGRMDKLRKKLLKLLNTTLVAPDAPFPHPDDSNVCQWWASRTGNYCEGLDTSIEFLKELWRSDSSLEGILGFSQGARMAHLMAVLHKHDETVFTGLKYIIFVSGYDAPLPDEWNMTTCSINIPSLHVWGRTDKLISAQQSQALMRHYHNPLHHEHDGGHHVPMRAANVEAYLTFIQATAASSVKEHSSTQSVTPDEDAAMAQQEEVEALSAIFPEEFTLLSKQRDDETYSHPIRYRLALEKSDVGTWPPHPVSLLVEYPPDYPASQALPLISLQHDNNMMEFSSGHVQQCLMAIREAAKAEQGMPCVLSCVYAAREFFESGGMEQTTTEAPVKDEEEGVNESINPSGMTPPSIIQPVSSERIQECNLQGLEIASTVLLDGDSGSKGGSWKYTIGLVGKPSAGKSTFFNAATGFARQRNDADNILGGATMAPHPFTTIDPNVGYCLVPAPQGSCPKDDAFDNTMGCTHGRDFKKRRLIPVVLKDVAGLVPGAYQGRGRGNKFLNDLTDADVLIHVVDASGTADTEGNDVGDGTNEGGGSHPLNDLNWIRNELVEWVYANLMYKWDSIRRRGRTKLSDMFTGYGQSQALVADVLSVVEKYMEQVEHHDRALDHLDEWDQGDVHRLVSAFLGIRFPMALALNKSDMKSAAANVRDVCEALPIHGAHVGIPLSARNEMMFVKQHLGATANETDSAAPPTGVWQCLQSSMMLREPVLVFPVCDMSTYAPLPGLTECAIHDASLPSAGMISCLCAAGGSAPSLWNGCEYDASKASGKLRDALVLKPGSTVEDVFVALKNMGALSGEFVRAEGAGRIGEKAKLVPKHERITSSNRILKIMTSKRTEWQAK